MLKEKMPLWLLVVAVIAAIWLNLLWAKTSQLKIQGAKLACELKYGQLQEILKFYQAWHKARQNQAGIPLIKDAAELEQKLRTVDLTKDSFVYETPDGLVCRLSSAKRPPYRYHREVIFRPPIRSERR